MIIAIDGADGDYGDPETSIPHMDHQLELLCVWQHYSFDLCWPIVLSVLDQVYAMLCLTCLTCVLDASCLH